MISRISAALVALLIITACGGGQPATAGAPTASPAGQSTTPNQPSTVPGEPIDSAAITAAVGALQSQESWQFAVKVINVGVEQSITGTERTTPEHAIDASHAQPTGEPFRYIRIGDNIWYDAGTGEFTEVQAADAKNLIDQYEPYYLNGLKDQAEVAGYSFDFVGDETVSGVAASHYLLSQADRDQIVEHLNNITADEFAGDVWIAKQGGYLMGLRWGPQSTENAQVTIGFNYTVTAVNCECPIEPPS